MALREILLTGSVPIHPASKVFEIVSECCGDAMARMPDGEQVGWVDSVRERIATNAALQPGQVSRIGNASTFDRGIQMYKAAAGRSPKDVKLGDLGIAANALASYQQFMQLRSQGRIRKGVRFQATVPGPATTGGTLEMPEADVYEIVVPALLTEIRAIIDGIPAEDLTIQFDLAVEVEKEEFRRRPDAFDTPVFAIRQFTFDGTINAVARLAQAVPAEVELGFHLCAMWHVYKQAGQDMAVHVDYANALSSKVKHSIAYIHLPTTPQYEAADFGPLTRLALHPETKLFLGLIHVSDGLEGAKRRMLAAQKSVKNFGVAHFCGLSQWGAGPETVELMLKLHRELAGA